MFFSNKNEDFLLMENLEKNIQKIIFLFLSLLCFNFIYPSEIEDLIGVALENNPEIIEAENTYNSVVLSSKTLNGVYSPGLSVSASSSFENNKNMFSESDQFSSVVNYTQPLPGGASLGISGTYSYAGTEMNKERYIVQAPNISFSLSQSLFPFWIQGTLKDPSKLNIELQKKYYYNQWIYIKKSIIQNLIQNYVYALIYKNESEISKNSIFLIDEQIEALKELKRTGNINQSRIIELENSRWNYYQNNLSSISNYENYIQSLKNLCGVDFEFEINGNDFNSDILILPKVETFISRDPLEENYQIKIKLLDSERIQQNQNSAPVVSVSVQPNWKNEIVKMEEWTDDLKKMQKPESWNAGVSINFSPFISASVNKNRMKFQLEYEQALKNYESYLSQKKFIEQLYQKILKEYENQFEKTIVLLEEAKNELSDYDALFKSGTISKLDYDSVLVRVQNIELSLQSLQINVWLYKNLIEINN